MVIEIRQLIEKDYNIIFTADEVKYDFKKIFPNIVSGKLKISPEDFDIFNILYFQQNRDCGYTLEPPRRGGSNEYPLSMFWPKNEK